MQGARGESSLSSLTRSPALSHGVGGSQLYGGTCRAKRAHVGQPGSEIGDRGVGGSQLYGGTCQAKRAHVGQPGSEIGDRGLAETGLLED